MKQIIAIPTTNGQLDAHFGHCKAFTLFEVNDQSISATQELDAPPHVPGKLPIWLSEQGVTDVIAGGMGQGAIKIFNDISINVYVGAEKLSPAELIEGFLNKTLTLKANYCNH